MKKYKELSKKELANIDGSGILPGVIAIYALQQAFQHSDQIYKGFKKGFRR